MNCETARPLVEPYADGELDAAGILEMERHLQTCPACSLALRNVQAMKKAVKQDALYFAAPAELRRKLKMELHSQVEDEPAVKPSVWNWWSATTTGFAIVCLAVLFFANPGTDRQIPDEIVSSHIRSLMAGHSLDVASTDQHTVKPWFDGKLDFAPPVKDFATNGFPLIGGRLDYVHGRAVAALVYQRNKHIINLFVWPGRENDAKPVTMPSIQGYNLIHWSRAGMNFWMTSDLNEKELAELAALFAP